MMPAGSISILKYSPELKNLWDEFVDRSKNGTFLFKRDYMDYHSDRFTDNSLLFYRKNSLYCILPANRTGSTINSHGGLTYGGIIMGDRCRAEGVLDVFSAMIDYLKDQGFSKIIYKPVPHIYHRIPSEEDLYALFRHDAYLSVRTISSTIDFKKPLPFNKGRKETIAKALKYNIKVEVSNDYDAFWNILTQNLRDTHNAIPVHSLSEIKSLASLFPQNIKLFGAFKDNEMIGGIVIFISRNVIHTQYISASPQGKLHGAVDAIISYLLENPLRYSPDGIEYFDFGTSNEEKGRYLNENLIYHKEGFGARAICYDTYEMNL